jgi:predicted transcriptional regulator YdeE
VHLKGFFLEGISVRTTNQNGQSAKTLASFGAGLWTTMCCCRLKTGSRMRFTVYTRIMKAIIHGFYTTVLGCKVSSLDNIPEGLISLIVPAADYVKYVAKGRLPDCVAETWQQVWSSDLDRKYIADFDVWGAKAQNPEDAEVEIYVGVK